MSIAYLRHCLGYCFGQALIVTLLLVPVTILAAAIKKEHQLIYYGTGVESATHTVICDGVNRQEEWFDNQQRVVLERAGESYAWQVFPKRKIYTKLKRLSDKDLDSKSSQGPSQYGLESLDHMTRQEVIHEGPGKSVSINGYFCYPYTTRVAVQFPASGREGMSATVHLIETAWKTKTTAAMRAFESAEARLHGAQSKQSSVLYSIRLISGMWRQLSDRSPLESSSESQVKFVSPPAWVKEVIPDWGPKYIGTVTLTEVMEIGTVSVSADTFAIPKDCRFQP